MWCLFFLLQSFAVDGTVECYHGSRAGLAPTSPQIAYTCTYATARLHSRPGDQVVANSTTSSGKPANAPFSQWLGGASPAEGHHVVQHSGMEVPALQTDGEVNGYLLPRLWAALAGRSRIDGQTCELSAKLRLPAAQSEITTKVASSQVSSEETPRTTRWRQGQEQMGGARPGTLFCYAVAAPSAATGSPGSPHSPGRRSGHAGAFDGPSHEHDDKHSATGSGRGSGQGGHERRPYGHQDDPQPDERHGRGKETATCGQGCQEATGGCLGGFHAEDDRRSRKRSTEVPGDHDQVRRARGGRHSKAGTGTQVHSGSCDGCCGNRDQGRGSGGDRRLRPRAHGYYLRADNGCAGGGQGTTSAEEAADHSGRLDGTASSERGRHAQTAGPHRSWTGRLASWTAVVYYADTSPETGPWQGLRSGALRPFTRMDRMRGAAGRSMMPRATRCLMKLTTSARVMRALRRSYGQTAYG